MFDFDFIFAEHEEEITLYAGGQEGEYNKRGIWIKGQSSEQEKWAIVQSLSNDDLQYAEEGVYTTQDVKIYSTEPLPTKVTFERKSNGKKYTIQEERDFDNPGGYYLYWARRAVKHD